MIPDEELESLDKEIIRLQKSTRTTVPALLPLHDVLRQRFHWYYQWSSFKYSKWVHTFFLIVFLIFIGTLFYRINFAQPGKVFAATVDFAPNAAGDSTQWTPTGSIGCGSANWCVTTTNDADTSYVSTGTASAGDLYNITNSSQFGIINSVSVYYVAKRGSTAGVQVRSALKTGGTAYYGAWQSPTTSYATYSDTWATNPKTSVAWTWSDVDNLQIGVQANAAVNYAYVTQVYAHVDYNPLLPPTAVYIGSGATDSQLTVNWTKASGATNYYISKSAGCTGSYGAESATGDVATTNVGSLTSNTSYCFRLRAYNGGYSDYSNVARGQTLATKLLPSTTLNDATTLRVQGTTTNLTADKSGGSAAATITSAGGSATYTNDSGNIITVENSDKGRVERVTTSGIARDPGGAVRIEEARTNNLADSSCESANFTDYHYVATDGGTMTADDYAGASPVHGSKVCRGILTGGGTWGSLSIGQSMTINAGDKYTGSVWVKSDSSASVNFAVWATGINGNEAGSTGAVAIGTGWTKLTATLTAAAAHDHSNLDLYVYTKSVYVYMDAEQEELGAYATSYIPTTTAAATRNAEVLYYAATNNASPIAGTVAFWVNPEFPVGDNGTHALTVIGGPSAPDARRIQIFKYSSNIWYFRVPNGDTLYPQWTTTSDIIPQNTWTHVALTWGDTGSTGQVYINGTNVGTISGSNPPPSGWANNTIYVGGGRGYANSLISDYTIFNTALSGEKVKGVYQGYAPSDINISDADINQLRVNWTVNSSDATNLHLERQGNCEGSWTDISTTIGGNDPNYTDGSPSANTSYCYRVHAAKTSAPDSGYVYTTRGQTLANKLKPSTSLDDQITFRMQGTNIDLNADKAAGSGAATITNSGANASYINDTTHILGVDSNNLKGRIEKVSTADIAQNPGGGVRIEEARTNLITYGNFSNGAPPTGWTAESGLTPARVSSPYLNPSYSSRLTNGAADKRYYQAQTLTAATHTISGYAQKSGGGTVDATVIQLYAATDLTSSGLSTTYTQVGSTDWYRLTATFTGTAASWNLGFYVKASQTVYVDCAQAELGAFATTYIPTGATGQLTRNAEVLTYPSSSNISMTAGTFSAWIKTDWAGNDNAVHVIADVSVDSSNLISFQKRAENVLRIYYRGGGSNKQVDYAVDWSANTWQHVAASWDTTSGYLRLYLNGAEVGTPATGIIQGTLDTSLYVGSADGTYPLNGLISDFTIFNTALDATGIRAVYSGYGPTVTGGTADELQITWDITDNSSNKSDYNYQHKQTADCTDMSGATSATNPDTGLAEYLPYCFQAQAYVTDGASSLYNVSSDAVYTSLAAPGLPTVNINSTTSLQIITNPGSDPPDMNFAVYNQTLGKYVVAATGGVQTGEDWETYATWGSGTGKANTSLAVNTTYTYQIKRRPASGQPASGSAFTTGVAKSTWANQPGQGTLAFKSGDSTSTDRLQITVSQNNNPTGGVNADGSTSNNTQYAISCDNGTTWLGAPSGGAAVCNQTFDNASWQTYADWGARRALLPQAF